MSNCSRKYFAQEHNTFFDFICLGSKSQWNTAQSFHSCHVFNINGNGLLFRAKSTKLSKLATSYPEIPLGKPQRRPPFSALAVRHEIQVTFKLGKVGDSLGKVRACLHHMLYTKLFRKKRSNPRAFSGFFIFIIKEAIVRQTFRIFHRSSL